jgi:hypothetical protein
VLGNTRWLEKALPVVAAGGAGLYVAALLALPVLEPGFNVLTAHPEDYATGSYGAVVNLSYVSFAVALISLVLSVMPVRRREIAVPILLVPPALLCAALAVDPVAVARGGTVVLIPILGLASAPLISSLVLRARFRPWDRWVVGFGAAVLVAFVGLVLAPDATTGAVNRAFDALAGLWVAVAALALRGPQSAISPPGRNIQDH